MTRILIIFLALGLFGCRRSPHIGTIVHYRAVEISDVPAPSSASVVVQSGANLRSIAKEAYGHEEFSGFVASVNGIADPNGVETGATLRTPSLPIAFRDAGVDPRKQMAINILGKTWYDLQALLPVYTKERSDSGVKDGQTFAISADLQAKLTACADRIDSAVNLLNLGSPFRPWPARASGQFGEVSASLRTLSSGAVGSRDYDVFMAEKRFALGFTYAFDWLKGSRR